MKYLDLTGLQTAINNLKSWANVQFGDVRVDWESIMYLYNASNNTNVTAYIPVTKFNELFAAATNAKIIKAVTAGNGFLSPSCVWSYLNGNDKVIGLSFIDIFGTTDLKAADFEITLSGTAVILTSKIIKTFTMT